MGRRSNSLIPAYPEADDGAKAKEAAGDGATRRAEIEVIERPAPLTRPAPPSALALAGEVADRIASSRVFEDYHERVSENTVRRHAAGLESFAIYLTEAGIGGVSVERLSTDPAAWREVTWGLVKGFVRWLMSQGYAIRTVNARLSTVRVYCGLAHEAGEMDQEQYSRIQLVRGYGRKQGKHANEERRKQEIPTRVGWKKAEPTPVPDDVARALKRGGEETPQGRRDALLMSLLLDHGLRCSEVADLNVEHFDLANETFTFYRRKVDLTQTHRLTADTLRAARAYLAFDAFERGPLLRASNKHGTLQHAGMSPRAITKRVAELGRSHGILKMSAHDCRHYWATAAVRNGTHVKDLQEAGGWASPAMPLQYAERAEVANEGVRLGGAGTDD